MSTTIPFSFPVPGSLTFGPNGPVFTPSGGAPVTVSQLPAQFSLPNLNLPNLQLPNLPTIPGLPADLSALLPGLATAAGAANPYVGLALTLLSVIIHIGQGLHTQAAAQPAGTNPSIDATLQHFWSTLTTAFPLPQLAPPQPAAPAAG